MPYVKRTRKFKKRIFRRKSTKPVRKFIKRRRVLRITRPIRQTANQVPPVAAKKAMKLYQGSTTLKCYEPASGSFSGWDLYGGIVQGIESQDRLGTKIRVYRVDINYCLDRNYAAVIPEENTQLCVYRTKRLYTGGPVSNWSVLFLRPPGSVAGVGPVSSLGGTDGNWPPQMWIKNPTAVPIATIVKLKNIKVYPQGSVILTGTTAPNALASTSIASVNINTVKHMRQMGKMIFNYRKGMIIQFAEDEEDQGASYIIPNRTGADNHLWIAATGESNESAFQHSYTVSWNVWYSDE